MIMGNCTGKAKLYKNYTNKPFISINVPHKKSVQLKKNLSIFPHPNLTKILSVLIFPIM